MIPAKSFPNTPYKNPPVLLGYWLRQAIYDHYYFEEFSAKKYCKTYGPFGLRGSRVKQNRISPKLIYFQSTLRYFPPLPLPPPLIQTGPQLSKYLQLASTPACPSHIKGFLFHAERKVYQQQPKHVLSIRTISLQFNLFMFNPSTYRLIMVA